ncbi:unnamed protein product [Amoebophrya sp. A25]|nr:unnamed protein product [Amoebophrya sp. A25]|eukprot:GSA25T00021733001.1
MGGTNLYFISAESLILHLLLFEGVEQKEEHSLCSSFRKAPQTLPAIHAMERILETLQQAGGKTFRLIFFDCFESVFAKLQNSESLWLLRNAFLMHCVSGNLMASTTPSNGGSPSSPCSATNGGSSSGGDIPQSMDVQRFQSWYDPAFQQHVKEWRPSFFLISDNFFDDKKGESLLFEAEELGPRAGAVGAEDGSSEGCKKMTKAERKLEGFATMGCVLKTLAIASLRCKLPVALLSGITHRGHRVEAFTLGIENCCRALAEYLERVFNHWAVVQVAADGSMLPSVGSATGLDSIAGGASISLGATLAGSGGAAAGSSSSALMMLASQNRLASFHGGGPGSLRHIASLNTLSLPAGAAKAAQAALLGRSASSSAVGSAPLAAQSVPLVGSLGAHYATSTPVDLSCIPTCDILKPSKLLDSGDLDDPELSSDEEGVELLGGEPEIKRKVKEATEKVANFERERLALTPEGSVVTGSAVCVLRFVRQTLLPALIAGADEDGLDEQTAAFTLLAKILLLSTVLKSEMPLPHRCFATWQGEEAGEEEEDFAEEFGETVFSEFQKFAAQELGAFVDAATCATAAAGVSLGPGLDFHDFVDGRFYRHVLGWVVGEKKVDTKDFTLAAKLNNKLIALWKAAVTSSSPEDGAAALAPAAREFWPLADAGEAFETHQFACNQTLATPEGYRENPVVRDVHSDLMQEVVFARRQFVTIKQKPAAGEAVTEDEETNDADGGEGTPAAMERSILFGDHGLDGNFKWAEGKAISSLAFEEYMEENRAQKKVRERKAVIIKKKGYLSKSDMDFFKKGDDRRRQQAVAALAGYANSLTGSKNLHLPILVKDEKMKKAEQEAEAEAQKASKKKMELLAKNEEKAKLDALKKDEDRFAQWEKEAEGLNPSSSGPSGIFKVQSKLLEMAAGYPRYSVVDDMTAFKEGIARNFTTKGIQLKISIKMLSNIRKFLKKLNLSKEKMGDEEQEMTSALSGNNLGATSPDGTLSNTTGGYNSVGPTPADDSLSVGGVSSATGVIPGTSTKLSAKLAQFVCYLFNFCHEIFKIHGVEVDGKGIKLIQEVLIQIGFPESAAETFKAWRELQMGKESSSPTDSVVDDRKSKSETAGAGKDKKGDKKDSKKDKKDSKKEKEELKKAKSSSSSLGAVGGKSEKLYDDYYVDAESAASKDSANAPFDGVAKAGGEFNFQLLYNGRFMTRTLGKHKEKRVLFKPDDWQKDLLDIVDSEQSALVVAPTASGKTFICYYTMERVLASNHEDIAVYVAPSKALVNQVSAEIYARFGSKNYPANAKNQLLGVFTREFNSAGGVTEIGTWANTQVLVTVPHCLETILLSPEKHEWVKRLRYIVFDEVHCIGESEGGAQWERTMQLIPCPFVALSATVSNPDNFHSWLSMVQVRKFGADSHKSRVHLIKHSERWNDLYKKVYVDGELYSLHPFACLNERTVRSNGMIADFSLTPSECGVLVANFVRLFQNDADPAVREAAAQMDPKKFFQNDSLSEGALRVMSKADYRRYEKHVLSTILGARGNVGGASAGGAAGSLSTTLGNGHLPGEKAGSSTPEKEESLEAGARKIAHIAKKFESVDEEEELLVSSKNNGAAKSAQDVVSTDENAMLLNKEKFNLLLNAMRVLPRKKTGGSTPRAGTAGINASGPASSPGTASVGSLKPTMSAPKIAWQGPGSSTTQLAVGTAPANMLSSTGVRNLSSAQLSSIGLQSTQVMQVGGSSSSTAAVDVSKLELCKSPSGAKMYQLCRDLDRTDNLPTIVFNFNRVELKSMVTRLFTHMQQMQYDKYLGTEEARAATKAENAKREAEFQKKLKFYEAQLKLKANDEDFDETTLEEPIQLPNVEDEVDKEFTFHSERAKGQYAAEIEEDLKQIRFMAKKLDPVLIKALERGIGMHWEAAPTKYKQIVEVLFRRGFLKVVFATGTLALGINMPCRSVVFTGNDVELTGLMFRQMAGRSGRRGFDLLGNVIFWGMPFEKISQLVASDLPHFPAR